MSMLIFDAPPVTQFIEGVASNGDLLLITTSTQTRVISEDPPTDLLVITPGGPPGPVGPMGPMGPQGPPGPGVVDVVTTEVTEQLQTHIQSTTPHPVYDDIPSLRLLFENGLLS